MLNALIKYAQHLLAWWYSLPRALRYLFVGGFNTMFGYSLYFLWLMVLGMESYQVALVLSYVLSSVFSFSLQRTLVFQNTDNFLKGYVRGLITWGIGYLLNAFILWSLVESMNYSPITGQIIALVITTLVSYTLFKFFVFSKKET